MKIPKKQYRVYYKYLLSYVAVFIIPIIAFTVFVHIYFVGILREEIQDTNYEHLAKSVEIIDTDIGVGVGVGEGWGHSEDVEYIAPKIILDNPDPSII